MKIEKIAENKIRIILDKTEFNNSNMDINTFMAKAMSSKNLLLMILDKAQRECNFNTDGHKLLIEAFSSNDDSDFFIFTITKYLDNTYKLKTNKKLLIKKRSFLVSDIIYKFNNFDEFCDLCVFLKNCSYKKTKMNTSLYLYNNLYFLVIHRYNLDDVSFKDIYTKISEFGLKINYSKNFENKLQEHGKAIIRKNAISTGIKYFSDT